MTDATLHTADGREIELTDDPDAIDAYATGLTVSFKQTASFIDYNSGVPFCSLRSEIRPALALNADGAIDALRDEAERMGRVVDYHVTQTVEGYREDVTERKGAGR